MDPHARGDGNDILTGDLGEVLKSVCLTMIYKNEGCFVFKLIVYRAWRCWEDTPRLRFSRFHELRCRKPKCNKKERCSAPFASEMK